jgi:hypothetical protein
MKTTKKTITTAEINALATNGEINYDCTITTLSYNAKRYPRAIRIYNSTAAKLGYVILQNGDEVKERVTNPEWFVPIPIEANITDISLTCHCEKFVVVRLDTTTATADLIMYFTNYNDM